MYTPKKLTPREYFWTYRNMAVAFEDNFDWDKALEESKEAKEDPKSEHWAAYTEDEEGPVAGFIMNLFQSRFDGHVVPMAGVGGVGTLPAYRRGGAIRACMEASFKDLYNRGYVLSSLYPFSSVFYRQFGFENGQVMHLLTLPLSSLTKLPEDHGKIRQLFPGDSLEPLLKIYNDFYGDCNLSVVREVYDRDLDLKKVMKEKRSIYVWEDESGEPGGFMILSRDGEVLNCRTNFGARNGLLFKNARALCGLLSFAGRAFPADFRSIRFAVPDFVPIFSLIPEGASMHCETFYNGMLRVLNVEEALKLCRCKNQGVLTVRVEDGMLPENNDTFRLTYAPGKENLVERVTDAPDITLPVGDFSALLLGTRDVHDLPFMLSTRVKNPDAELENVFYKKPCQVLDLF